MRREELIQRLSQLRPLLKEHGAKSLRLVCSYARDDAKPDSDVDLIADFDQTPSFLELISLEQALEAALGLKVDLATEAGLRPSVRARIAADAVDV
tara:strand:+ start:39 stop:326 length:288 start_codon:yes stop_codon:yes gene_type:complete